jgi:hypothetical protein
MFAGAAGALLLIVMSTLWPAPVAHAEEVEGLYQATIPIDDQTPDLRRDAIRSALTEVLARVSGRTGLEADNLSGIDTAIEQATRYVQQYRYRVNKNAKTETDPKQALWVKFDPQAVDDLLRQNGLPVWGKTRPETLIWLAIDEHGQRHLVGNNSEHEARQILQQQAKLRGLPIRLPFLDLADRSALQVTDVWGNFEDAIARASERYQTEAVLVGRVHKTVSGLWQARWTLYQQTQRNDWAASNADLKQVLIAGIDNTTRAMAIRYANLGSAQANQVLLRVNGIHGLGDYTRVLKYLRSLGPVTDVEPAMLRRDAGEFRLTTRSGRLAVAQAVSLGHVLVEPQTTGDIGAVGATPNASGDSSQPQPDLVYRLIP